jgi:carboxyl-terminal processing protease
LRSLPALRSPTVVAARVALTAAVALALLPAVRVDVRGAPRGVEAVPFATDSLRALETFDEAWTRIRDTYYDPGFGGLDWDGVRVELRPRAEEAASAEELRDVIREMLDRLSESHFVLIPREAAGAVPGAAGGGSGTTGLEVRWIGGAALVTRVDEGGPAARAGIRPGIEIVRIEGHPVSEVVEEIRRSGAARSAGALPPYWISAGLAGRLRGPAGSDLELTVADPSGTSFTAALGLVEERGELVRFGHLPPFRLRVEDRIAPLPDGRAAGVLHFSGWFPGAAPLVADAVDRFRELDGIVVDLRGNPGGVGGLAMGIGGHFLDERVELGTMRTRQATLRFVVNPQLVAPDGRRVEPFAGPVAILVDGLTGSTSEIFAAGMQSLGRARVFGEPTAGEALPSLVVELPNGDRLMHAIADFTTPDGTRLEGRGVRPDEIVAPDRASLLERGDPVLERALEWISRAPRTPQENRP